MDLAKLFSTPNNGIITSERKKNMLQLPLLEYQTRSHADITKVHAKVNGKKNQEGDRRVAKTWLLTQVFGKVE